MNLQWFDWIGLLGTALVVGSYFLLQSGRLSGTSLAYQLLNIAGSSGILVSLFGGFNLAVAVLQCIWIAISVYGIVRGIFAARRTRVSSSGDGAGA
jgi:paired small multidrug resistance pump